MTKTVTVDWRLLVCWNSVLLLVAHAKAYPALIYQWRVPAPLLCSKVALPLTPDVPKQLIAYPMTVSEKKRINIVSITKHAMTLR